MRNRVAEQKKVWSRARESLSRHHQLYIVFNPGRLEIVEAWKRRFGEPRWRSWVFEVPVGCISAHSGRVVDADLLRSSLNGALAEIQTSIETEISIGLPSALCHVVTRSVNQDEKNLTPQGLLQTARAQFPGQRHELLLDHCVYRDQSGHSSHQMVVGCRKEDVDAYLASLGTLRDLVSTVTPAVFPRFALAMRAHPPRSEEKTVLLHVDNLVWEESIWQGHLLLCMTRVALPDESIAKSEINDRVGLHRLHPLTAEMAEEYGRRYEISQNNSRYVEVKHAVISGAEPGLYDALEARMRSSVGAVFRLEESIAQTVSTKSESIKPSSDIHGALGLSIITLAGAGKARGGYAH